MRGKTPGGCPSYASGGRVEKGDFHPVEHPGALHRDLGIPQGEKIPARRLEAAAHSKDKTVRRRAVLAETMKKWKH